MTRKTKLNQNPLYGDHGSPWKSYIYIRILHECLCIIEFIKQVGKRIGCEAVPSILSLIPNELNKFNDTGERMQDSFYHTTLKSHFNREFAPQH